MKLFVSSIHSAGSMVNLCTLFDSNYLDKGIVLYKSLEQVSKEFCLYVLAMNDKCYEVLIDLNYPYLKPIRLEEFENKELIAAKGNRSKGEYCWTCSSSLIKYLLTTYQLDSCTYVDADMYFYQDPKILVDEMIYSGASAQVVEHRFPKWDNRAWRVGTYCVEFNTFKNDKIGLQILDEWVFKCLEKCSQIADGIHWGDQKYLDPIVEKYREHINVLKNLGGGVAPWNIAQYKGIQSIGNTIVLQEKSTKKVFELVFFHYEGITYANRNRATVPTYLESGNNKIITTLYADYLMNIEQAKQLLQYKYDIDFVFKEHPVMKNFKGNLAYYVKKIGEYILHPRKFYIKYKANRSYIDF